MPEQLSSAPSQPDHHRHESLKERLFGLGHTERRTAGNRKIGGFGIRLMMERLRLVGHNPGNHSAEARQAASIESTYRIPAARQIEAAPTPPALPMGEAPSIEGGRHRPENIAAEYRVSVADLTGTHADADGSPNIVGSGAWHRDRYEPRHAVSSSETTSAINSTKEVIGSPAWRTEHEAAAELPFDDPYVPRESMVRPGIPGVIDGSSGYVEALPPEKRA